MKWSLASCKKNVVKIITEEPLHIWICLNYFRNKMILWHRIEKDFFSERTHYNKNFFEKILRFFYKFLKAFKFAVILVHCLPYSSLWKEGAIIVTCLKLRTWLRCKWKMSVRERNFLRHGAATFLKNNSLKKSTLVRRNTQEKKQVLQLQFTECFSLVSLKNGNTKSCTCEYISFFLFP